MNSAIYVGRVGHRRYRPVEHAFAYSLFMMYLDLDEVDHLFEGRWLWSARRPAPAWFRRRDYLGDPARPLAGEVRDLVERRLGRRPTGPIRLLTHLRYWGYCFNPVSFYFCHEGEAIPAVVAEITNTPWNERHAYVLPGPGVHRMRKEFHVSPFMGMEQEYEWRIPAPDRDLRIHMENFERGERVFDATLTLERREISGRALAGALLRHPFMTGKAIAGIYWQALRLRMKRAPFHAHPAKAER